VSPLHDRSLEELVLPVQAILRSAGQLILDAEEAGFGIERKSDKNYVTEVDLAVQKQIVDQLALLTPSFAIMAEEEDLDDPVHDRPVWILDPVDGTTNLMRHTSILRSLWPWQTEMCCCWDLSTTLSWTNYSQLSVAWASR